MEGYVIKNIKDQIHLSLTVRLLPLKTKLPSQFSTSVMLGNVYSLSFEYALKKSSLKRKIKLGNDTIKNINLAFFCVCIFTVWFYNCVLIAVLLYFPVKLWLPYVLENTCIILKRNYSVFYILSVPHFLNIIKMLQSRQSYNFFLGFYDDSYEWCTNVKFIRKGWDRSKPFKSCIL